MKLAKLKPDESENDLNELRVRLKDLQKSSIDPELIGEKEKLTKSLASINSGLNNLPKSNIGEHRPDLRAMVSIAKNLDKLDYFKNES